MSAGLSFPRFICGAIAVFWGAACSTSVEQAPMLEQPAATAERLQPVQSAPPQQIPQAPAAGDHQGLVLASLDLQLPSSLGPSQTEPANAPQDRLVYFRGRDGSISQGFDQRADFGGKTLQLNFVDAPVQDVARALVNDVFGETLLVADGAEGTISLTSPEPVAAETALHVLEAALAESGLALTKKSSGFMLTRFQASGRSTRSNHADPAIGFSAIVIPVKHAAPSEVVRLVEPFAPPRVSFKPDDELSLIVIQGAQIDAQEAINAIKAFDAPFLTDRIFGMFEIRYSDAETVKAEIESVMGLSRSPNNRSVEIISLPRLNRLFIAARDESYFQEASNWIDQLDRTAGGDERRLRYYVARNTPASVLAQQLSAAFGGSAAFGFVASASGSDAGESAPRPQPASFSQNNDSISIVSDELNNALIIRATDTEYREILALIERMDVLAPQVLIEATIAEVTLTDDMSYGVRWSYDNAESSAILSDTSAVGAVFPGFSYTYLDTNVRAALNLLASATDVTVLSAPSIVVQNNQSANLQVGDEVPIVTQQATGVADDDAPIVSNIELRNTGVILEVKPRINASDMVVLDIMQEVSDVVPTTTSGIDSPTIQQRKFTSTVSVRNKGTVALGGLIRETQTDNESGIPVLKDIPGLGMAFKSKDNSVRRTELMIFLTPRIIRDDNDAAGAINHLRQQMNELQKRIGHIDTIAASHTP